MKNKIFFPITFLLISMFSTSVFSTPFKDRWDNKYLINFYKVKNVDNSSGEGFEFELNVFRSFSLALSYENDNYSHFSIMPKYYLHGGNKYFSSRFWFISAEAGLHYGTIEEDIYDEITGDLDRTTIDKNLFLKYGLSYGIRNSDGIQLSLTIGGFRALTSSENRKFGDSTEVYMKFGMGYSFGRLPFEKSEKAKTIAKTEVSNLKLKEYNVTGDASYITEEQKSISVWDRKFTLLFHGGFGTPIGFGGAELNFDITKDITMGAGVGEGLGGVLFSLMGRYKIRRSSNIYSQLGGGVSYGKAVEFPLAFDDDRLDDEEFGVKHGVYLNAEYNWGYRFEGGFVFQATLGFSFLTTYSQVECTENCYHTSAGGNVIYTKEEKPEFSKFLPYFGLSIGYNF
jgi:hypothetical protein